MSGNCDRSSMALLTDLYQLTMACGYFQSGAAQREAVFHAMFRRNPFEGGFAIACGLAAVIEFLQQFRFGSDDLDYLAGLRGNDERALFSSPFLDHLREMTFACEVDAVPEGTVVFPYEPLIRVRGPIMQAQLLETPLLNLINFPTLVATKAARVCLAARGEPVLEFGLRRAQGSDGGLTASRSSYVGGCSATSNVLAGKRYGIPVKGTHAHSWVMCFDDELDAFKSWAMAMPNNCVFLVDTYDTLAAVHKAVEAGRWLREQGHEMIGIRLDSGDLAYLSTEARKILDAAGFEKAVIMASSDLDEHIINSLKQQKAAIRVWGVGTRLATAHDDPALTGVYKLSAVREPGGAWRPRVKLSEQLAKTNNPGIQQVRRFFDNDGFVGDVIYDEQNPPQGECVIVDPLDQTRRKHIAGGTRHEDLLVPIFREGKLVYEAPSIHDSRQRCLDQLERLHPGVKRFVNPHQYPAGLEQGLHNLKTRLILEIRGEAGAGDA